MDDAGNATEDVEMAYEVWRRGVTPPSVIETLSESAFEEWSKKAFIAGWIQRGRIPAKTTARS
jgi:hypothetical protein